LTWNTKGDAWFSTQHKLTLLGNQKRLVVCIMNYIKTGGRHHS